MDSQMAILFLGPMPSGACAPEGLSAPKAWLRSSPLLKSLRTLPPHPSDPGLLHMSLEPTVHAPVSQGATQSQSLPQQEPQKTQWIFKFAGQGNINLGSLVILDEICCTQQAGTWPETCKFNAPQHWNLTPGQC